MNSIFKNTLLLSIAFAATLSFTGCGAAAVTPANQQAVDAHQKMYTQRNMWGQPSRIDTTNFSVGGLIPVNSIIFYNEINSKQLRFEYNGKSFYLRNIANHSQTNLDEMLARYFATTQVDLSKFSVKEQNAIKSGKVEVGMSKEAVLVSRGFPPAHATPDLSMNDWTYWKFQRGYASDTIIYTFSDNKISSIKD